LNTDDQEKINDDLLYDPNEEEEDEKWMANERLKYVYLSFVFFHTVFRLDLEERIMQKK
jgi:hypothetical protein